MQPLSILVQNHNNHFKPKISNKKMLKEIIQIGERVYKEFSEFDNETEQRIFLKQLSQKELYAFQKYVFNDPVNREIYFFKKNKTF